jgi:Outer membrane protein beta-barrel domain
MTKALFNFASIIVTSLAFSSIASAQSGSFKLNPKGVSGSAGAGIVLFDIQNPTANFSMDQGVYGAVGIEKGVGALNLFVTLSLAYLTTKGETNYDYTALNSVNYTGSSVPFKADIFQSGLGLRFKLLTESWFRPYVEGGGLAGYYTMTYEDDNITGGSSPKLKDALLDFGYYGEAGLELAFSQDFGVRVGMRMTQNETKPFETLDDDKIKYKSEVYFFTLLKSF